MGSPPKLMLKVIGMRVGARESVTSKCNVLMAPYSRANHACVGAVNGAWGLA